MLNISELNTFFSFYIKEPDLIFGGFKEEKDPRLGLEYYGPFYTSDEKTYSPKQARIGIIGSGTTISRTKEILDLIKGEIKSDSDNKWLFPDYPGATQDKGIRCDFITSDTWNVTIYDYEIQKILQIKDPNIRINKGVKLFLKKLRNLKEEEPPPDVIICALPKEIEDYCGISEKTRGAKRPKYTELEKKVEKFKETGQTFLDDYIIEIKPKKQSKKSYDFRNALKGRVMKYGIPIQIIKQSTIEGILGYKSQSGLQHPSSFSWNFSTGLYYKARGRPWRLAKLTEGTCYVGVAFYENKLTPKLNMETSMAQVFTHTGEGFVLRGKDVIKDKRTREIHLKKDQAEELLRNAIKLYSNKVGHEPKRVVLHKTSEFTQKEQDGFENAIPETPRDFVSLRKEYELKFLRTGDYPILRGTVIQISDNEYLLYTAGYIPRLRTYPGHRIPIPLRIKNIGDSEISLICSEILGLTKLNWNTTQFSTQNPITLEFAKRVGDVLSELPNNIEMRNHYRFYM